MISNERYDMYELAFEEWYENHALEAYEKDVDEGEFMPLDADHRPIDFEEWIDHPLGEAAFESWLDTETDPYTYFKG